MSQEFFLCVGAVFVCRNSFRIPWDGMPHPWAYPIFHDEINFWMIPNFILSVKKFFKVKIPSTLIMEIYWSWKFCQPDPCAWPRVQLVKDSNPFFTPLLNLNFFLWHSHLVPWLLVLIWTKLHWWVVEKNYIIGSCTMHQRIIEKNVPKSPSAWSISWIFFFDDCHVSKTFR